MKLCDDVCATFADGTGTTSGAASFCVKAKPQTPELSAPKNNVEHTFAKVQTLTVQFSFGDSAQ